MFRRLVGLWVVVLSASAFGVHAEDVSNAQLLEQFRAMQAAYEGRIAKLEGEVKTLRTQTATMQRAGQIGDSIDRAIGETGHGHDVAQSLFAGSNPVRATSQMNIGGYSEFNYTDRGDTISSFDQARTVLELGAKVHDNIQFYMELEYEHGAVIEGGEETGGELELEQAWVDVKLLDQLSFRSGMILVPLGRYNLYHEGWANNFVDRPLVNRRIAPTTWFEEGLGIHGQALDEDWLGISYEAYVFNPGRADEVSTGGGFRGIRNEGVDPVYDSKKAGSFRVAFEPARSASWFADYFEVGFSGYITAYDGVHDRDNGVNRDGGLSDIWALDVTYEKAFKGWGTLGFRGEAVMAHAGPGRTFDPDDPVGSLKGQQAWGYYAETYFKFWPSFLDGTPLGKETFKNPELVFAVRYDWIDRDRDVLDQGDLGRVTLGISYRPVERTVFKFDYQMDRSPSNRHGTGPDETGFGDSTDAFLFGVAVGF